MAEEFNDIIDYLDKIFTQRPHYGGIVFIVAGAFLLFASIKGYEWMYEGSAGRVFHIAWIRNEFGESVAKGINIALSIILILVGIAFYFLWK